MTVYGVFHNPCYHESAAALVSLHATKQGAYKALRKGRYERWQEHRDEVLRGGYCCTHDGGPLAEAWFMRPLEVQP